MGGNDQYNKDYLTTKRIETERSDAIEAQRKRQAEADALAKENERKNIQAFHSGQTGSISQTPGLSEKRYDEAKKQASRGLNENTLTPNENKVSLTPTPKTPKNDPRNW